MRSGLTVLGGCSLVDGRGMKGREGKERKGKGKRRGMQGGWGGCLLKRGRGGLLGEGW